MKQYSRALVNNDDTCIKDELSRASSTSRKLQIAVAFLSDDNLIRRWIKKGVHLEILVARRYPTNPSILRFLLHTSGNKIQLKWLGPEFHAKVVIGCNSKGMPQWASVGSANFTNAGLESNDEFNIFTEGKDILEEISAWFDQLWKAAAYVNPEELKNYEAEYDKVQKGRTKEPRGRAVTRDFDPSVILDYKDYWNAVDTVQHAIRDIVGRRFPACKKYPYLAIWGFWHWLKYDCPKSATHAVKLAIAKGDASRRDALLRSLFLKYSIDGDPEWPTYNITEMRRMRRMILRGRLPSSAKLLGIIDQGFRNTTRLERNSRPKRLSSLRYLLRREGEDVLVRAGRLLRDPKYTLLGAKEAAVFGWLGWAYPETYPAMNQKAIDGLKKLGLL